MAEVDVAEIKKWLARGDMMKLASEVGITPEYASRVIAGKSKNMVFLEKAIELAFQNKAKIVNGIERLKSLSPSI